MAEPARYRNDLASGNGKLNSRARSSASFELARAFSYRPSDIRYSAISERAEAVAWGSLRTREAASTSSTSLSAACELPERNSLSARAILIDETKLSAPNA